MAPQPEMDRTQVDSPNTTEPDDGRLARGRQRMRELLVEDEAARQAVADGLVRDLGRTPSAAEVLLIEGISSQAVEGRKLRRRGQSSEMQDRLVSRDLRRLGIKPGQAKPATPEYLKRYSGGGA